ncbi:hypothetical protein EW026_g2028 [Hermanssonia centrifuga]|uniref:Fatty acid desaturase domain-containing protein n=1 Tax=Hermanssonia centrifuga TaxID=98765 RepID=A0A4S4KU28_9APHY|nr:hypothetical protein EW026_g2028 [Hermanssonia centrifuga]
MGSTSPMHDSKLAKETSPEEHVTEFQPMTWSLKEIRAAIPAHLFLRDTFHGLRFLTRDVLLAAVIWKAGTCIDPLCQRAELQVAITGLGAEVVRWIAWSTYWWFQGLVFTGIWVIGHETRSDLGLPRKDSQDIDWEDYFGDTPIYTLLVLVRQQLLAFPAYLLFNVSGQKVYPPWTNHFNPNSVLFTKEQASLVLLSNTGLLLAAICLRLACKQWGAIAVIKYYGIPWLLVTHWFIMITFLHHTDPLLPHYRGKAWNYQRGAAATVDRNFLGWQGRFFLHDVAHFHVIHHFFPKMPFYHGPEATMHLKAFIGEHYMYSDKPIFNALWDNYNSCQFVEDEGSVLFYRDRTGKAIRRPAAPYATA